MHADAAYIQRLNEGFIAEPQCVPAARHAAENVRGVLGTRIHRSVGLLVSELITAAVRGRSRRSGKAVRMRVWTSPTSVRVAITDRNPESTLPSEPGPGEVAAEGWGLFLTKRIADRWGVHLRGGTEVWFEIDTPR